MTEQTEKPAAYAAKPFVYVAVDYTDQNKTLSAARELSACDSDQYGFKTNLDCVANFGETADPPYKFIKKMMELGRPVFVDMKMWNGNRTMGAVAKGCADLGAKIVNMYAQAGVKFIGKVSKKLEGSETQLFTVGLGTHYTEADAQRLYGKSFAEVTLMLSEWSVEGGAHGLIIPGTQLETVSHLDVLKICPGIRPEWYEDQKANDQEQIVTPALAVQGGANGVVIGSPITKSENKVEALEKILTEMNDAA
jgi:orotidine-5'-phosphate decarboxylase